MVAANGFCHVMKQRSIGSIDAGDKARVIGPGIVITCYCYHCGGTSVSKDSRGR